MIVFAFPGSGATSGFDKVVHLLGLRKGGRYSTDDGSATSHVYACAFPSCKRSFAQVADLQLHQRTHRDGDFHSLASAAAATPSTSGLAFPEAAVPLRSTPLVLIGPYAHHSNLLPW